MTQKAKPATMNNGPNDLHADASPTSSNGGMAVAQIVASNNNHAANHDGNNMTTHSNGNACSESQAPKTEHCW